MYVTELFARFRRGTIVNDWIVNEKRPYGATANENRSRIDTTQSFEERDLAGIWGVLKQPSGVTTVIRVARG